MTPCAWLNRHIPMTCLQRFRLHLRTLGDRFDFHYCPACAGEIAAEIARLEQQQVTRTVDKFLSTL